MQLDEVFVEFDGPQIFTCKDLTGGKFLVVHLQPQGEQDRWLYVRVSARRLKIAKSGGIDIHDLFAFPELGSLEMVCILGSGEANVYPTPASQVTSEELPLPGQFLVDQVREVAQYTDDFASSHNRVVQVAARDIARLQASEEFASLPRDLQLSTPMWELSPAVIDFLKSKRTPVEIASNRTGRLIADFTLQSARHRTDVPVAALGSVLTTLQKLIDALAQGDEIAGKGPVRAKPRAWAQLDAVAAFPSSFGLRVESHQGSTVPDTQGIEAFAKLLHLLDAGSKADLIRARMSSVSGRAMLHYRAFAKALDRSASDFSVTVGFPGDPSSRRAQISRLEISTLRKYLEAESELGVTTIEFRGRLTAASLRSKFFLLEDDQFSYGGRISDSCLPKVNEKKLNGLHFGKIEIRTEINETTGEESKSNTLLDIREA